MNRIFYFLKDYRDRVKLLEEVNKLKEEIGILEKKLAQQVSLMDVFEKNIKDIIYFKDRKGNFIRINKALADKFNIKDPKFAVGKNDKDLFKNIDEFHAKESYKDECDVMDKGKAKTGIIEHVVYPNGDNVWQITDKFPLYKRNGEVIGTWGRSIDITEREKNREELEKQSKIDGLTNILSREYVSKIIDQKIKVLLGWKTDYAELRDLSLVFLDLNGFKKVNDSYGHDAGDIVLKEVSSFITSRIRRDIDIFGRWGGDEFVILYPNTRKELAEKLVDKINEQIRIFEIEVVSDKNDKKHKIKLSFSKGVVNFRQCINNEELKIFKGMFDKMKSDIYRAKAKEEKELSGKELTRINIIDVSKDSFVKAYNKAKKEMRNNKINIVSILNYYKVPMIDSHENIELKEIMVNIIKNVFIYIADREMYKDKKKNL
jgi:diguanylate cyclase (GGDEF)-like protein